MERNYYEFSDILGITISSDTAAHDAGESIY